MTTPMAAQRLTIYLGESDSWRGRSLYMSILETLRDAGIAGATVTRALAGYGAHSRVRTQTIEVLSMDLPIVIAVIDTPENIARALPLISPMVREGLITLEDVRILKYTHRYLQPLPADRAISEVMTRPVTTVRPETSARRVVELLLGKLFKAVPVVDDAGRVVGIITDHDLLGKAGMPTRLAIVERLNRDDLREFLAQVSSEETAATIMTAPVFTARDDESLGYVTQRLVARDLKRMPVVDSDGKLVGMISRVDVLHTVAGERSSAAETAPAPHPGQTLAQIMTVQVTAVHVNDDLADVLRQMLDANVTRVVVLDELEHPVGVITDGDLVARVSASARPSVLRTLAERVLGVSRGEAIARDLMSKDVLTTPLETSVVEAVALLLRENRKALVVVDAHNHAVGIVGRQTLMAASLGSNWHYMD